VSIFAWLSAPWSDWAEASLVSVARETDTILTL
jgi:hypothetical protein